MRSGLEAYSQALQVLKLTLVELNGELDRLVSDPTMIQGDAVIIAEAVDAITKDVALLLADPIVALAPSH